MSSPAAQVCDAIADGSEAVGDIEEAVGARRCAAALRSSPRPPVGPTEEDFGRLLDELERLHIRAADMAVHGAADDLYQNNEQAITAARSAVVAKYEQVVRERDELQAESNRWIGDDRDRLDFLEARAIEDKRVEIWFAEAWTEFGEMGAVLSSGPREFWLNDSGTECGPTLREAIDAASRTSTDTEKEQANG